MEIALLLGRVCFSWLFITSGIGHLTFQKKMLVGYAQSKGLPMPGLMIMASGLVELIGGLLIVLGFHAQYGAWLVVLFLVPVTLSIHNFWAVKDPMAKMTEMANFEKNLALLGGALIIAYFGPGPLSLGS